MSGHRLMVALMGLAVAGCSTRESTPREGAIRREVVAEPPSEESEETSFSCHETPPSPPWGSHHHAMAWASRLMFPGSLCLDGELDAVLKFGHDATSMTRQRRDGWGRPLRVHCDDVGVYVYSVGPDGQADTADDIGFREYWMSGDPRRKRKPRADEPKWS
ncbi:MAG: hypothetical protein EOO74_05980, partial [Myxococcales bacterium]